MEQEQFIQEVLPLREQLLHYSRSFLENPEDAEDVVQEAMMKLWYMRNELHTYNSIKALSVQMTKNLCLNRLKVVQRRKEKATVFSFENNILSPYTQLEQKDSVSQVMKIIDRLPGLQQTILRMRHIDGFEMDKIVEITGSKPEAVRMNLSRARKKVKEYFLNIQS
jgi:RNA polymerase sigma-70 factor (ECF subfamily)